MIRILFISVCFFLTSLAMAQQVTIKEGEIYVKIKTLHISKVKSTQNNGKESLEMPGLNTFLKNKNKSSAVKFSKVKDSKNGIERIYKIKIDSTENFEDVIRNLKKTGYYEFVEKKLVRNIIFTPNDPGYSSQYHLRKIKAPDAWDLNPGGATIVVAVIDNAVQTTHPDLQANMLRGFDVSNNDLDPNPPDSTYTHGSHVAGIVGAVNNNGMGISSAANNKVKVLPIKATPDGVPPSGIYDGFEAIVMAADSGAKIISISWGGNEYSQMEQDVIDYARSKNALVVAAAGNSNNDVKIYPAAYNHVISVACLDSTDIRSSFSSFGNTVDVSAPGRGILSTIPFNKYIKYSGTSMATPLVSACLGYIWSCFPTMSLDSLELLLKNTTDNIDIENPTFVNKLGTGRVNLLNALACKTQGLDALTFNSPASMYICNGDSITLTGPLVAGASYQWYMNSTLLSETSHILKTNTLGRPRMQITKNQCKRSFELENIKPNPLKSPIPLANNIERNYCQGADTLKITGNLCVFPNFVDKVYSGPTIGYDANLKSGAHPFVDVNDVPGNIDSIQVSVTWVKKAGGDQNSCGLADLGNSPFNEELSLSLLSPSGKIYDLVASGSYKKGLISSGIVTTTFKMSADSMVSNLPITGNFKPMTSFLNLNGKPAFGTWTLLANDNSGLDPLCVSGFKIRFYTNANTGQQHLSWWSASTGGSLLSNNGNLIRTNMPIGTHEYYAQNKCDFYCVSDRKAAKITIKNTPSVVGIPTVKLLLTAAQIFEISNASTYSFIINPNNTYNIQGINSANQPFSYLLSNSAPEISPISICNAVDYLLIATGCAGQVSWNTGELNAGFLVKTVTANTLFTASCNQAWSCTPPPPTIFNFQNNSSVFNLTQNAPSNSLQSYFGSQIISSQTIKPVSKINYTGSSSILLQPGFSVENGNVFKAQIGVCP